MTSEPRCDCCDLPPAYCGREAETRQRRAAAAERARLLALPGVIAARFPGRCAACPEPIRPGDPITASGHAPGFTGAHAFVHADCRAPF